MKEKDLFKIIKQALQTKKVINMKSSSKLIEEWDSLGQLAILSLIDKKLKNKASTLNELVTAESVKKIHTILKKAKLIV